MLPDAGKARRADDSRRASYRERIRRDGHVRLAPCTARGAIRGEAIDADATIDLDTATVEGLLARKYGWQYRSYKRLTALMRKLRGRSAPTGVTLRITPR
jgi:hypothetical protein